jgi:hypothetical protein
VRLGDAVACRHICNWALAVLLFSAAASAGEPQPFTVLEKYGPLIDRAEANELGLFHYRPNFGALRFVRAGEGSIEARVATDLRGVMLEQAVPLDSPMLARVEQGLLLLRDQGISNVELLLAPSAPLDASCLGPAIDDRTRAGAACFGLLGLGAGLIASTAVAYDSNDDESGRLDWRQRKIAITGGISLAAALLGGWGGWSIGSHADAGRPRQPQPRCAIAGYDDFGYPFYEEEVRGLLSSNSTTPATVGGMLIGFLVAGTIGSIVANSFSNLIGSNDPNGVGMVGESVLDLGIVVSVSYIANTIGRDMDRESALLILRHRPRAANIH